MKIALFADIHANLPALEAVLADSLAAGCDRYAILGDSVNYGLQPRECLDLIGELDPVSVLGNHDLACSHEPLDERYRPRSERMFQSTASQLRPEQRAWLRAQPLVATLADCTLVHANLRDPAGWGYIFTPAEAALNLARQETPVCFIGHTHQARAFGGPDGRPQQADAWLELEPDQRYLINVGSVGQPREGSESRAAYCIYEVAARRVEFRKVAVPGVAQARRARAVI